MADLTVERFIGSFLLLALAAGVSGYLAGTACYHFGGLLRMTSGGLPRGMAWLHFAVVCLALGYYSNIFLPVLLVSAYSAWFYHRSLRIRREKNRALLAGLARMRAACVGRSRHPAGQPSDPLREN